MQAVATADSAAGAAVQVPAPQAELVPDSPLMVLQKASKSSSIHASAVVSKTCGTRSLREQHAC
jgi:hypothetical protein